jgi:hypothetical protein
VTTNRLEAFSDGVLAIAITLLVIEIHPPEIHQGKTLAHALWAQWPSYLAYMVSFLTTRLRFMVGAAACTVALALAFVSPALALVLHGATALYYTFDQATVPMETAPNGQGPAGSSWTGLRQARDEGGGSLLCHPIFCRMRHDHHEPWDSHARLGIDSVGWLLIIHLIIQTILSSFPPRLRAVSRARGAFEEPRGPFFSP